MHFRRSENQSGSTWYSMSTVKSVWFAFGYGSTYVKSNRVVCSFPMRKSIVFLLLLLYQCLPVTYYIIRKRLRWRTGMSKQRNTWAYHVHRIEDRLAGHVYFIVVYSLLPEVSTLPCRL